MEKKCKYQTPQTFVVNIYVNSSIAKPENPDRPDEPGTQLTGSFQGNQAAKGTDFDSDFEQDGGVGEWSSDWSSEWKSAEE